MTVVFFTDRQLGRQFPGILRDAGLNVEIHDDHFDQNCPDPVWLHGVGSRGWFAFSRDKKIRYRPNERDAVMRSGLGLFILMEKAPYPKLARHLFPAIPKIERFIERTPRPFIAKVYRAPPSVLAKNPDAVGDVTLWLSVANWRPGES